MKNFRKISFLFILTAMVMLTLHALVPHHHQPQQGADLICTTSHHKVHQCSQHQQCIEQDLGCCGEDILCGLSHTFIHSSNDHVTNLWPALIEYQNIIPVPNVSQQSQSHIISNDPIIRRLIICDFPLRAPPVA